MHAWSVVLQGDGPGQVRIAASAVADVASATADSTSLCGSARHRRRVLRMQGRVKGMASLLRKGVHRETPFGERYGHASPPARRIQVPPTCRERFHDPQLMRSSCVRHSSGVNPRRA
jgi:hypothetical protein